MISVFKGVAAIFLLSAVQLSHQLPLESIPTKIHRGMHGKFNYYKFISEKEYFLQNKGEFSWDFDENTFYAYNYDTTTKEINELIFNKGKILSFIEGIC